MNATCTRVLGLVLTVMLAAAGCDKIKSKDAKQQAALNAITWKQEQISVNGANATIEVGRYDKPIAMKVVPIDQAKRATPIDTMISLQSVSLQGQDDKDMKVLADHYMESQEFITKHPNAKGYFDEARKADDRAQVVGLIKSGKYTLVVSTIRRASPEGRTHTAYRGTCMQEIDGKFYIDEKAKLMDPVLRQLTADEYKVLKKQS